MKCKLVILLLVVVGISLCEGQNFTNTHFDYFKLSLEWPNSYCLVDGHTCRDHVPQYFTIDSLYPHIYSANGSKNCSSLNLVLTDDMIARHEGNLLSYWPNLSTYDFEKNKKYWKEKWRKHGSCSSDTMLPEQYIRTAIQLRNKHNLNTILANTDIKANGSSYSAERILNAIRRRTGFLADIVCEADRMGNVYLTQIHQCVDKPAKKFIDCNNHIKNCDSDPIFPGAIPLNKLHTARRLNGCIGSTRDHTV